MLKNRLDTHAVRQNWHAIQLDWAARGFSCELWVDPPGQVWSDFVHDVDEVVHVVDGAIQIEMAGRVLRLAPSEEVLIPAGSHHTVRNIGPGTSRWLYGYRQGAAAS
jgi:mannose-6-phosphate isomerase-like protein (cupin superfamily)